MLLVVVRTFHKQTCWFFLFVHAWFFCLLVNFIYILINFAISLLWYLYLSFPPPPPPPTSLSLSLCDIIICLSHATLMLECILQIHWQCSLKTNSLKSLLSPETHSKLGFAPLYSDTWPQYVAWKETVMLWLTPHISGTCVTPCSHIYMYMYAIL